MKNNYIKNILSVIVTVGLSYSLIYAWNTGLTATSGTTLTADNWNKVIANIETNSGAIAGLSGGSSVFSLNGSDAYYNAGNVGIGTNNPTEKLDVIGNLGAGSIQSNANGNYHTYKFTNNNDHAYFSSGRFRYYDEGTYIGTFARSSATEDGAMVMVDGGNVKFFNQTSGATGNYSLNPTMIIKGTGNGIGNVGIGTSTPTSKLDVNGKISATAFGLDIQYVETVGANSTQNMSAQAACPANYSIMGGGCNINKAWNVQLIDNFPDYTNNIWKCSAKHEYGTNENTTAFAICVKTD